MPYYITRESQECAGYAVVSVYDDQTELHGCHLTRQAAIDQMVAMSKEEGIEPGGDLDQIEETIEEDMAKPAPVVQLAAPVTIISFSGNNVTLEAAAEGKPSRTISGIAVPYGETATVSDGTQVRFMPGSLPVEGKAPKLFMYHDASQPVGLVTSRVETDQGMLFQAKISNTAAGNDALELAKDGVIDAVSVGVNPTEYDMDGDVMVVRAAQLQPRQAHRRQVSWKQKKQ
jgi:HK97 family phage prohead protease